MTELQEWFLSLSPEERDSYTRTKNLIFPYESFQPLIPLEPQHSDLEKEVTLATTKEEILPL